ncbi:hypothetical protein [Streptomyces decoyicus]|uniref:hypothetical protein n=1 Tax=Streptomyces decoyicus TaxID=249567 RepID=UPI003F4D62B5
MQHNAAALLVLADDVGGLVALTADLSCRPAVAGEQITQRDSNSWSFMASTSASVIRSSASMTVRVRCVRAECSIRHSPYPRPPAVRAAKRGHPRTSARRAAKAICTTRVAAATAMTAAAMCSTVPRGFRIRGRRLAITAQPA